MKRIEKSEKSWRTLEKALREIVQEKGLPPVGWRYELCIKEEKDSYSYCISVTDCMSPQEYVTYEADDVVFTIYNETNNIPGFPEEYGDTWEEAKEAYLEEQLQEALDEIWERLNMGKAL